MVSVIPDIYKEFYSLQSTFKIVIYTPTTSLKEKLNSEKKSDLFKVMPLR